CQGAAGGEESLQRSSRKGNAVRVAAWHGWHYAGRAILRCVCAHLGRLASQPARESARDLFQASADDQSRHRHPWYAPAHHEEARRVQNQRVPSSKSEIEFAGGRANRILLRGAETLSEGLIAEAVIPVFRKPVFLAIFASSRPLREIVFQ